MKKSEEDVKTRGYKLLLFADNPQHMRVLRRVKRLFPDSYCGIWHIQRDEAGKELITGHGKKHAHIILHLDNPVYWRSLCKKIGFVREDGTPDYQFCRAIGYDSCKETVKGGYVYLVHANSPSKEQYAPTSLFGSKRKVEDACAAIVAYEMRHITMAESVVHAIEWVESPDKEDKVIRMADFAFWICGTPYFKASSSPVVRGCIAEHNERVYAKRRENNLEFSLKEKSEQRMGFFTRTTVSAKRYDWDTYDIAEWNDALPEGLSI